MDTWVVWLFYGVWGLLTFVGIIVQVSDVMMIFFFECYFRRKKNHPLVFLFLISLSLKGFRTSFVGDPQPKLPRGPTYCPDIWKKEGRRRRGGKFTLIDQFFCHIKPNKKYQANKMNKKKINKKKRYFEAENLINVN